MIVGLIYARPWSALLKQWLVDVSTTARDSLASPCRWMGLRNIKEPVTTDGGVMQMASGAAMAEMEWHGKEMSGG